MFGLWRQSYFFQETHFLSFQNFLSSRYYVISILRPNTTTFSKDIKSFILLTFYTLLLFLSRISEHLIPINVGSLRGGTLRSVLGYPSHLRPCLYFFISAPTDRRQVWLGRPRFLSPCGDYSRACLDWGYDWGPFWACRLSIPTCNARSDSHLDRGRDLLNQINQKLYSPPMPIVVGISFLLWKNRSGFFER